MFNKKLWKRKTMNNYKYKEQSGRSMIEMLGVLAIIGVLSVGGIAGYSKAMNKFKTNKVADNVSMLVANIKTMYAQQNSYNGLDNVSAVKMGLVPDELTGTYTAATTGENATPASQGLENAFNGSVYIKAADSGTGADSAFYIIFNGLSKEACVTLATNDWGSSYSSGLVGMKVSPSELANADDTTNLKMGCTKSADAAATAHACPGYMPMAVTNAAKACGCNDGNKCSIMWKYY